MASLFRSKKFLTILALVVLAVLLYQPIFGHLGALPLRQWDETRLAHSALEMYWNGFSIVPTYAGAPEMWNTKPPLMIWLQATCMHAFGPYELAVRFPSALAAFLTCVVLVWFSWKNFKNIWIGIVASLVLVTIPGYIGEHGTRTGDYDSLLTLFTTSYLLSFFLLTKTGKNKYFYLFFIALTLSALTKGIAAFMFLPALFIYIIFQRKLLATLKNPHLYLGILILLAGVLGYYLGREAINPGYLQAVGDNELGGRFSGVLDNHQHPFFWYINNMFWERTTIWIPFLLLSLVFNFISKGEKSRRLIGYLTLISVVYLLVISSAATKLWWYDIPLFPIFSLIIAVFLYNLIHSLSEIKDYTPPRKKLFATLLTIALFTTPYIFIFDKTYAPKELPHQADFYRMGHYLQLALNGNVNMSNRTIVHQGIYDAHLWYYIRLLNKEGANAGVHTNNFEKFSSGDTIIVYQPGTKSYFWDKFYITRIDHYQNIEGWILNELKPQPAN